MKTPKPLTFTTIPTWAMPEQAGVSGFFTTIALAGLEGTWIRLSADTQRALLGKVIFGKQQIRVAGDDGEIAVFHKVGFGLDGDTTYVTPTRLRSLLTF